MDRIISFWQSSCWFCDGCTARETIMRSHSRPQNDLKNWPISLLRSKADLRSAYQFCGRIMACRNALFCNRFSSTSQCSIQPKKFVLRPAISPQIFSTTIKFISLPRHHENPDFSWNFTEPYIFTRSGSFILEWGSKSAISIQCDPIITSHTGSSKFWLTL